MKHSYYLGIDQGTTGTTVLVLDENFEPAGRGYAEHCQFYPQPGWVEHDPLEIWEKVLSAVSIALREANISVHEIQCVGIDNQGESVVVWDRITGRPVCNAIVWQDRRTSKAADSIRLERGDIIRKKTGLLPDSYFSATKIQWILDHVEGVREAARRGRICAGTMDAWLIWKLTGGRVFLTDISTASRTMLCNIHTGDWDDDLLNMMEIPRQILPEIRSCAEEYGETDPESFLGGRIPISGSAVDQQAALFGQACFRPGMVKSTYGTGAFLLMNTGETPVLSRNGLLTSVAWQLGGGKRKYVLDGGVYIAGAAVQWLRDKLRIIENAAETEAAAGSIPDNGGVYFVPAFTGLAAPYWDQYARGMIIGITGGTTREQLVRAALESIAYQVSDNLTVLQSDLGMPVGIMRADGGAAVNSFLMQFQADISGIPVDVPYITETSALGAAYLAACGIGVFKSPEELSGLWRLRRHYEPKMSADKREYLLNCWHRAVSRSKNWAEK